MSKKKGLILSVIGLLGLILITVGVTYAFFSYVKEGTTENTVTTGTITFLYTEIDKAGAGISIENAFPMDDTTGKAQTGAKNVFNFKVEANTKGKSEISYEVTARKSSDSTLDEEAVRIYLTEVSGDNEKELLLDNYNNLTPTSVEVPQNTVEKTIYTGKVASNTPDYKKEFRLRMWIDEDTDFSQNEDGTYPYNDKKFTVTVNVYANAKVVTQDETEQESVAEIESIQTEGGVEFTKVEGQTYNYEATLPEGTTETTINIETSSSDATVSIEKLDSLENVSSNKTYSVKRLSTTKTLQLTTGDNYFKVTVTSANKEVKNEFILKVTVMTYEYSFTFKEEPQEFSAPKTGNYKLEVWGASGNVTSASNVTIGYGGYSTGVISLTENEQLFIYTGGQGKSGNATTILGSYNGGGAGKDYKDSRGAGSGGGATHIATSSGLLSELETDSIIIVAGGGGGVGNYNGKFSSYNMVAGSGGGYIGGMGDASYSNPYGYFYGYGGTQTEGGKYSVSVSLYDGTYGSYGQGGSCASSKEGNCSGGGGGYYGGASNTNYSGAGGGGSGYIANSRLSNKVMYCYNCEDDTDEAKQEATKTISTEAVSSDPISKYAKIGNGYAKITYLGN